MKTQGQGPGNFHSPACRAGLEVLIPRRAKGLFVNPIRTFRQF